MGREVRILHLINFLFCALLAITIDIKAAPKSRNFFK